MKRQVKRAKKSLFDQSMLKPIVFQLKELVLDPRNGRQHSEANRVAVRALLEEFGQKLPILVEREGMVVKVGNCRVEEAIGMGYTEMFGYYLDDLTKKQIEAFALADNRVGEMGDWNFDNTDEILRDLGLDFDLAAFGLDDLAPDDVFAKQEDEDEEEDPAEEEGLLDNEADQPGALALKPDMQFDGDPVYGIPNLRADMFYDPPTNMRLWYGRDTPAPEKHKGLWFWSWNTDSVIGLDFKNTVIGFYCEDYKFEPFWTAPDTYVGKLLNRRPKAVLSPNFSLWYDMPTAVKIWNTYRSRWIGRYMQEAGIKVIPDFQASHHKSWDYVFAGLPKNIPCVSVQLQTAEKQEMEVKMLRATILEIKKRLNPGKWILYVGNHWEEKFGDLFEDEKAIVIVSRVVEKTKALDKRIKETKSFKSR